MSFEDLNFTGMWVTSIFMIFVFSLIVVVLFYGITVKMPQDALEREQVRDMSCSDLKYYILDDGLFKSIAKEVFIWRCEK